MAMPAQPFQEHDALRVLVVSGSPDDRANFLRLLKAGGNQRYQFAEADSGMAAVRLCREAPPNFLLLSDQLPDMTAAEVLAELGDGGGLPVCPAVVIMDSPRVDIVRAVIRAGAQDFLGKEEITTENLCNSVANAAKRWRMIRGDWSHDSDFRANEERLRLALEASATGLWTWDMRTDAVTWSPECYAIHGLARDAFAGTGAAFFQLVHSEDRDRVNHAVRSAIESHLAYECEFRIVRPSGEVVWVANRARASYDSNGRPLSVLGTITDINDRKLGEERLRQSAETFRHLVEHSPFGVYTVDSDFRIAQVSQGAGRAFANVLPVVGRDFSEVMHVLWPEPFAAEAVARFRHTLTTGEPYLAPTLIERREDLGEIESYDWKIERVTLPDGRPGVVCHFYDLSERQRYEEALRESESFYRQTLESIPGMVFTTTADGTWDYVSEQWAEFTAVSAFEQLSSGWVKLLHPDDRERATAVCQEAIRGNREYDLEYRVRRHDGQYEWFKIHGRAIRDTTNTIVRWLGTAVNIDGLKQAEAALVARENELQTLANNSPDILTRFDRQLRHIFVNIAVEKVAGRSWQEFIGKTNRELEMPAHLCVQWDAAIQSVFESGQIRSLEFDFSTDEGIRHFSTRLAPEFGADGVVESVLGVTRDVTERKQYVTVLQEQDRRKDEFLAILAHELRNPLAPIRNGLQILRLSGETAGPVLEAREMMERQLTHLVHLVDDLLDISRVSRGKITLRIEKVAVAEMIKAAIEACRPTLEAKRHTLVLNMPPAALVVDGDRTRLVQVVGNLITNAAKYSEDGGQITITARRLDDEAVVSVTDTGVGIAAEVLPTLWDMFTQVRDTLDKAQGGLGIGLSLVKKLVGMHGGKVSAESAGIGQGSKFTVWLPLALPNEQVASAHPTPLVHQGAGADGSRRRVLVVDDNRDGAESLAMLLRLLGHQTSIASTGQAALDAAVANLPDVVFCDIGLPGMDGYEVARRLRSTPDTAQATLVAITGWGSEDDKRRSLEAGFDCHLTKPVALEAIHEVFSRTNQPAKGQRTKDFSVHQRDRAPSEKLDL